MYELALKAGKQAATLHADNVGFPPPDKYADHEKILLGRRKGTKTKVYRIQLIQPLQYQVRMRALNHRGIWWCPYCRKMRHFVYRKGFRVDGIWVPDEHHACPLCSITHRDGHVRKYNPIAQQMPMHTRKGRKRNRYRDQHDEEDEE